MGASKRGEGKGGGAMKIRKNSSCFACGAEKEKEKVQGSEMRGNQKVSPFERKRTGSWKDKNPADKTIHQ